MPQPDDAYEAAALTALGVSAVAISEMVETLQNVGGFSRKDALFWSAMYVAQRTMIDEATGDKDG